jgi:broad-specificity NMP kinase
MNIDSKHVLILGAPGSGKTTLSKKLKTKYHYIIHTDSFGEEYGYENGLYKLISFIEAKQKNYYTLVEGTLGYRLLRKIAEDKLNIKFDLILNVDNDNKLTKQQTTLHKGNLNIIKNIPNLNIISIK